jgi:hypothetical protein
MKTISKVILFLILYIACGVKAQTHSGTNIVSAQIQQSDSTKTKQLYLVTKLNNLEYVGEILSDDGHEIFLNTENVGKIYIQKSEIKSIEKKEDVKPIINIQDVEDNSFSTMYIFSSNALPFKKGTNYGLLSLLGPEAHFALTDNLSVGILSAWIASPFAATVRYSFKTNNENLHYSVSSLFGTSGYFDNFDIYLVCPNAAVTWGKEKKNLTIGFSYLFVGAFSNPSFSTGAPMLSFAGTIPITRKTQFIFDSEIGLPSIIEPNNIYTSPDGILSIGKINNASFVWLMPGVRFQSKPNSAFQISLSGVISIDGASKTATTTPFPIFSWFFKF